MSGYDEALLKRARALHDAPNVTMDGHNDLPWALHDAYDHRLAKFDLREPQGHIKIPKLRHQYLHTDFPRCRKGGLTAQFWSVYVPTTIRGGEAVQKTLEQIDCVHRLCEKYPDHLEFAYTAADVRRSAQIMLDGAPDSLVDSCTGAAHRQRRQARVDGWFGGGPPDQRVTRDPQDVLPARLPLPHVDA